MNILYKFVENGTLTDPGAANEALFTLNFICMMSDI